MRPPLQDPWPPAWLGPLWAPGVLAYIPVAEVIRLSDPSRGYVRTALFVSWQALELLDRIRREASGREDN